MISSLGCSIYLSQKHECIIRKTNAASSCQITTNLWKWIRSLILALHKFGIIFYSCKMIPKKYARLYENIAKFPWQIFYFVRQCFLKFLQTFKVLLLVYFILYIQHDNEMKCYWSKEGVRDNMCVIPKYIPKANELYLTY